MSRIKSLVIDLKNRTCKNSIIVDIQNIGNEQECLIDLDVKDGIGTLKELFLKEKYEELKNKLESFNSILLKDEKQEQYKNFKLLKEFLNEFLNVLEIKEKAKKEDLNIEEILITQTSYRNLKIFNNYNELSELKSKSEELMEDLNNILRECNLSLKLQELIKSINDDNISYIEYILKKINFYFEEDTIKMLINSYLYKINKFKETVLEKYNEDNKEQFIKSLIAYKYKNLIIDRQFSKYVKNLKEHYDNLEELDEQLKYVYVLYELNISSNFGEYYDKIYKILMNFNCLLNNYYIECITRKIYTENKKYYNINDLNNEIENYLNKIDNIDEHQSIMI